MIRYGMVLTIYCIAAWNALAIVSYLLPTMYSANSQDELRRSSFLWKERPKINGSFPVVPNVRGPGIYTGIREASSTEQKGCNLPLEVIEPRSQSHKEPTKFVWWMRWYGTYTTEGSGALCVCIVYRSSPTSIELFWIGLIPSVSKRTTTCYGPCTPKEGGWGRSMSWGHGGVIHIMTRMIVMLSYI